MDLVRFAARVSDNQEVFPHQFVASHPAVKLSAIEPGFGALGVPAIAHASIGNELQLALLRKYPAIEIERRAQAGPDDHQIAIGTFKACSRVLPTEKATNGAAGISEPRHNASPATSRMGWESRLVEKLNILAPRAGSQQPRNHAEHAGNNRQERRQLSSEQPEKLSIEPFFQ